MKSSQGSGWMLPVMWLAVILSALSVVYVSHLCRQLYNDLSQLEQEANAFQVEWGRYLLEQSSWASLSRIEQLAKTRLEMRVPGAEEIIVIRP
jgi:cell division protein FtsL